MECYGTPLSDEMASLSLQLLTAQASTIEGVISLRLTFPGIVAAVCNRSGTCIDHPALWAQYLLGLLQGPSVTCTPLPAFPWEPDEATLTHDIARRHAVHLNHITPIPPQASGLVGDRFNVVIGSIKLLAGVGSEASSQAMVDQFLPSLKSVWESHTDGEEPWRQSDWQPVLKMLFDAISQAVSELPSALEPWPHGLDTDTAGNELLALKRSYAAYYGFDVGLDGADSFWHAMGLLQSKLQHDRVLDWLGFTLCLMDGEAAHLDKVNAVLRAHHKVRRFQDISS